MPFNYHTNATFYPKSPVNHDRGYGCNGSLGVAAALGALANGSGLSSLFAGCTSLSINEKFAPVLSPNELELLNQKAKELEIKPTVTEIKDESGRTIFRFTKPNTNEVEKQDNMNSYIKFKGDKLPNSGFSDFDDLWWYAYVGWSRNDRFGFGGCSNSLVLCKNLVFNEDQNFCRDHIDYYKKYDRIFKTHTFKPKKGDHSEPKGIIALQSDIEAFNDKYPSKIHDELLFQFLLDASTNTESGMFPEVDPEKIKSIVDSIVNS